MCFTSFQNSFILFSLPLNRLAEGLRELSVPELIKKFVNIIYGNPAMQTRLITNLDQKIFKLSKAYKNAPMVKIS